MFPTTVLYQMADGRVHHLFDRAGGAVYRTASILFFWLCISHLLLKPLPRSPTQERLFGWIYYFLFYGAKLCACLFLLCLVGYYVTDPTKEVSRAPIAFMCFMLLCGERTHWGFFVSMTFASGTQAFPGVVDGLAQRMGIAL